ncbi:MAG TPA: ABC transporter permease [Desulfobacterales bacterium]
MLVHLANRLMHALIVILAVSLCVFFVMYKAGDPVELLLPPDATQQQVEDLRRHLGLDQPFWVQYSRFLKNALQGDVGKSFIYGQSALTVVMERLPATLELATAAMILAVFLGIPLGVVASMNPQSPVSKSIMFFSLAGISVPTFWTGMVLVLVFAVTWNVLPSSGRADVGTFASFVTVDGLRHLLLPAVTLCLFQLALILRLTKSGMMEVLLQDYIKLARAKGLPERVVVLLHALKNTLIPVVTIIGIQFGELIAFTIVTETIFAWPGTGKLIIDSIQNLDRPVVVAYLMVVAVIFVLINLFVDVIYTFIDPRVRAR